MIVGNQASSCLMDEFFAKGGKVRKMPTGATASRPSTMPRAERDAYIRSRRTFSSAARRNYLTVDKIHEVEAMIERRASIEEIASVVDRDPSNLFSLAEKLELSGIAYPEYLRESMETPFAVLRDLSVCKVKSPPKPPTKNAHLRALTKNELDAFESVRSGVNASVAVMGTDVGYDTFTGLIAKRFGCVSELRKLKTNEAMLDHLSLLPTLEAVE